MKYCELVYQTKRRLTREVMIGKVGVGGKHPIRIQSMTTSNTRDVEATVLQVIRLADSGCEIARITVQGMKEAEACEEIKNRLVQRGYEIPLVADIHFFPPAALKVVDYVDKVRINPGNFADRRATFQILEYDDVSYAKEIEKIEKKFAPLVEKCKRLKRSIRIGTNHGSLSDRIMNRYGDTPQGMVESAIEYAEICRKYDFHELIFSMKSSNPQIMIQAYRLLVAEMYRRGWDYPLHLGVTEAGQDEDGRVKSAMGIGALLLDGIGDTIRVSLTEDPWYEIDPCQRLVRFAESYEGRGVDFFAERYRNVEKIERRSVVFTKGVAFHRDGTVLLPLKEEDLSSQEFSKFIGAEKIGDRYQLKKDTVDQIVFKEPLRYEKNPLFQELKEAGIGVVSNSVEGGVRISKLSSKCEKDPFASPLHISAPQAIMITDEHPSAWEKIKEHKPAMILLNPEKNRVHYARQFFDWIKENHISVPIILHFSYDCSKEDLIIQASAEMGSLLCDGLGDGLLIEGGVNPEFLRSLSFRILQAARMRTFQTEFISCPSCGRTLFDLQDVTKRIRSQTSHLPGVKIAIMGCIVNGPGEMADADFGYVGSGVGKIDLYFGKQRVEKDIDFSEADQRLIQLIKSQGKWIDKEIDSLS